MLLLATLFSLTACGGNDFHDWMKDRDAVITDLDLTTKIAAPIVGDTPVKNISTTQYTGTIVWQDASSTTLTGNFAGSVAYTATVTLTAKKGYIFKGVKENSFSHTGAVTDGVTNPANSGTVTIVFPITAPAVVSELDLTAKIPAPATDGTPLYSFNTTEYNGIIAWEIDGGSPLIGTPFAPRTVYKATVTLTANAGYTFDGVGANTFNHSHKTSIGNNTGTSSITVTILFPATNRKVVDLLNLTSNLTAPVKGNTPVTTFDATPQYTGSVQWKTETGGAHSGNFAPYTVYKAEVTLTPTDDYTFTGVGSNSFTYTDATVTNDANSGTVTITFPRTAPAVVSDIVLTALVGLPQYDGIPTAAITTATQYTGTVAWKKTGGADHTGNFAADTAYTATITLTAKAGFTFTGVGANTFTHTGADLVTNDTGSSSITVTIDFPATGLAPTYLINGYTDPFGTVTASAPSATAGTTVTLTVAPTAGYGLSTLIVSKSGGTVPTTGGGTSYTFIMPAEAVTVTAVFTAIPYAITIDPTTNGSVSASPTPTTVGTPVTLTVTPNGGYGLSTLTVTAAGAGTVTTTKTSSTTYTFNMPPEAVTVTAEFLPTYTVSFNGNGAESTPTPISGITSGNTISAPTAPVWTDNVFLGWYDGSTKWDFGSGGTPVTSSITLTAKWQYTAVEVWNIQDFGTPTPTATVTDTEAISASGSLQAYLNGLASPGNYVVNLTTGTHSITVVGGYPNVGVALTSGVKVSLRGSQTITLANAGRMFRINSGAELSIRGPTLTGISSNSDGVLVYVDGGILTLHEGSITGNTNTNTSVNTTVNGGGVSVYNGGTFTMSGGTISGNTAERGGGVYVYSGTFIKSGGIIYGNDATNESNKNIATSAASGRGHAVYYTSGGNIKYRDITLDESDDINNTDFSTPPWDM